MHSLLQWGLEEEEEEEIKTFLALFFFFFNFFSLLSLHSFQQDDICGSYFNNFISNTLNSY